jgi:murein DD-endopeptidase MepM/ murein hydrolase activator NlpD
MVRATVVAGVLALGTALAVTSLATGTAAPPSAGTAAAATAEAAPDDATPRLRPPLDAPVVVARPFDGPAERWAPGHRGVDLATQPVRTVRAPGAGVVTFSGTVVDRGVVTITHDDGLRSSLEPVVPGVAAGQRVRSGQAVATVASVPGHCVPATCLHWGLRRGETYLDPMRWVLDRGPVVLLPGRD